MMERSESIPPWLEAPWRRLQECRTDDRLPHALLLAGPGGVGKALFARELAEALLCTSPRSDGRACGACRACRLINAGSHPDLFRLEPVEGRAIPVEGVRALREVLALRSQYGGWRIAWIAAAERMTSAAANALLKTLEEPGPQSLLLLVSDRPDLLPATVRSRCQRLALPIPPHAQALAWLTEREEVTEAERWLAPAGGAPFAALERIRSGAVDPRPGLVQDLAAIAAGRTDPLVAAERCAARGAADSLRWISSCVMDMIRLRCCRQPVALRNPDLRESLQRLAADCPPERLFHYLDRLNAGRREAQSSINDQLLLEDVLIAWYELAAGGSGARSGIRH